MKYQFPVIKHIDDVLPAIEGRDEFVVAERDGYKVVNYMVAMSDTFPEVDDEHSAIRRECRGIIFDENGNLIARRLHKFFNVNERDETLLHKIDLSQPHVILEKLDGSMITPFYVYDSIRWGTKMGLTDVAKPVEDFVARNTDYHIMASELLETNLTPIFEWCSRSQRIVVDYPEDRLVLIAIRDNVTGKYLNYEDMKVYINSEFDIDVVKAYPGTAESMQHLIDDVRGQEGIEGYVIRFDDGHMVKIKGDWYVRIHKVKDSIAREKNIIDLIVNEKIDDAKAFMLDSDRERVEDFEEKFWKGVTDSVTLYEDMFRRFQYTYKDKKEFAIGCSQTLHPLTKGIMFSLWDGKNARDLILDMIRRNLGTQTKVDSVRSLWYGYKWNYSLGEE